MTDAVETRLCVLTVGPFCVLVEGNCPPLGVQLRERYAAFAGMTATADPDMLVRLELTTSERRAAPVDVRLRFAPSAVDLDAPGLSGCVDIESGRATLRLSSDDPAPDVDYFLRVIVSLLAFAAGGVLFHSAGVVGSGEAYVFFGPSGAGKSTVARNSAGRLVLADDLTLLMPLAEKWHAHSTPFWNGACPERLAVSAAAPVAALYRLVKDETVRIEEMATAAAVAEMAASAPVVNGDDARMPALLDRCAGLARHAPVRRLHFAPDASYWAVV